jgi:uncharacterized protein
MMEYSAIVWPCSALALRTIVLFDRPPSSCRYESVVLMRTERDGERAFFREVRKITPKGYDVVCERCRVANTFWLRFRGFMLRRSIATGEGMLFERAGSIHMFFMRIPLDIVFVDRELRVVKVARGLKPWRVAGARGAHTTIELAAGAAAGVDVGDRLELV